MNAVWMKLTPQFVRDATGSEEQEVINNLVEISRKSELNVEENDFIGLLQSHTEEMSNETLMKLEDQRNKDDVSEEEQETEPPKRFKTKQLAECFNMIDKGLAGLEAQDPNTERFAKVFRAVRDAIASYKLIYDEKKKATVQISVDKYILP
jgi:hypothetical protein